MARSDGGSRASTPPEEPLQLLAAQVSRSLLAQVCVSQRAAVPASPMSNLQTRRHRLMDQQGLPHRELDEHVDSIEEAWSFAIRWWQQQHPAGAPCATRKAEPCKGEPTGH